MKALRAVSLANTVVMLLAVLWGAWVTSSDSGDGCGASWPLCKGTFMPDWDYAAIVEFGHRVVSALAGLLSVVVLVWVARARPAETRLKRLAFGTFFFVVLQGALGAAAVLWPQPDLVMALHFGFSLLCFTFALLVTVGAREAGRPAPACPPSPPSRRRSRRGSAPRCGAWPSTPTSSCTWGLRAPPRGLPGLHGLAAVQRGADPDALRPRGRQLRPPARRRPGRGPGAAALVDRPPGGRPGRPARARRGPWL